MSAEIGGGSRSLKALSSLVSTTLILLVIDVATWVGIGALFTYGYVIGRQEGLSWPRVLLNALVSGSFGLFVLALKVLVH